MLSGVGVFCVLCHLFPFLERCSDSKLYGRCSVARMRDGRAQTREKEPRERGRGLFGIKSSYLKSFRSFTRPIGFFVCLPPSHPSLPPSFPPIIIIIIIIIVIVIIFLHQIALQSLLCTLLVREFVSDSSFSHCFTKNTKVHLGLFMIIYSKRQKEQRTRTKENSSNNNTSK